MLREARLSRFYGFPVVPMDGPAKLAFEAAMPILDAEQELKKPVPDDRVYDVILAKTGSEEQAADALFERIQYRLRRDEKFEG